MGRDALPKKRKILVWSLILLIPFLYSCVQEPKISKTEVVEPESIEVLTPAEDAEDHPEIPKLESPVEIYTGPKVELHKKFNQPNGPNDLVKYFAKKLMEGELSINLKSLRREFHLKGVSNAELVEVVQDAALQNPQISLILYPAILMRAKSIGYFAYKTTEELENRKFALENKVVDLLGEVDLT